MTYQAIALSFGHVESAKAAWLIFQADTEFESRTEALHSLTEFLYRAYCIDRAEEMKTDNKNKRHMAECCRKAWAKNNKLERCPECEALYKDKVAEFYVEDWQDFLFEILNGNANSIGGLFDSVDSTVFWDPFGFAFGTQPEHIMVVPEHAEVILTIALSEIHPELDTES